MDGETKEEQKSQTNNNENTSVNSNEEDNEPKQHDRIQKMINKLTQCKQKDGQSSRAGGDQIVNM